MVKFASAYAATAVVFLVIDLIWLGYIARSLYAERMGDLLLSQPRWGAALAFYLLFPAGLVTFAVLPGLTAQSLAIGAAYGALLGLIAYGTYDLTNLAVLKGWPADLAVIDMAWGTLLSAIASIAGIAATRAIFGT